MRAVSLCCLSPWCCLPCLLQIGNGVELAAGPSVLPWPVLDSAEHEAIQGFSRNSSRNLNANKNKCCPVKWLTQVRLGKWQQPVWELFSVTGFFPARWLLSFYCCTPKSHLGSWIHAVVGREQWPGGVWCCSAWPVVHFCKQRGPHSLSGRCGISCP